MAHEPCGFEGDAKNPVKLVAADALLGRAKQEDRLQPDMQLDMAGLENGADLDSERFPTGIALVQPDAGALSLQRAALVKHPATRADTPLGPDMRLHEGVGVFLAVVRGFGQDRHLLFP